ncbi:GPCR, family 2-like [Penicillium camemberti]|uniref:GPCR, family 2-like n=1 Tax=Penicillium camemberti (strain FM 013) TaxID=1429867 RepID=A0A0G4PSU8_PENC3|nr:GPCR, family 2-like [Penicillium camemberti]
MSLTDEQLRAIAIAERVGGSASLLGCAFIVTTYCASNAFRKPVNRLIFYASFGNAFAAVASLMSRDGVIAGPHSALCLAQAFFIQYWMPTDSLWSFCMAVNIYLTFYRRYSAEDIKKLEKWYFLFCYGLPLILATTLSLIKTAGRGKIYGPALIWCSITEPWQVLRLLCFYGPVYIATFAIYATAGVRIWRQYGALKTANEEPHVNRAMGVTRSVSFDVTATAAKGSGSGPAMLYSTSIESQHSHARSGLDIQANKHNAMRSYLRYSFLFFIAMVATWLPSFVNRIYGLVNPSKPKFGLNLAGALVLSLQGLWNAIIYTSTALPIFKAQWASIVKSRSHRRSPTRVTREDPADVSLEGVRFDDRYDAGSTSSLAIRPPIESSVVQPGDA